MMCVRERRSEEVGGRRREESGGRRVPDADERENWRRAGNDGEELRGGKAVRGHVDGGALGYAVYTTTCYLAMFFS
jgi:hypothetical protein